MEYLILSSVGLAMGLLGGLLGIGGSVVMIPALVFAFGENQHLYQASAMICSFFIGAAAMVVHKKAEVLMNSCLKWLIPSAALGQIIGVAISNTALFKGENSYLLARILGGFMIYIIAYNCYKLTRPRRQIDDFDISGVRHWPVLTILCGFICGIPSGLLGLGGGVLFVPAQQLLLKMPLKRAIANSAATVAIVAIAGASYKNATLPQHNIAIFDSIRIALIIIPTAIAGSFLGGIGMHKFPSRFIRAIFVLLLTIACFKLLSVAPG